MKEEGICTGKKTEACMSRRDLMLGTGKVAAGAAIATIGGLGLFSGA